MRRLSTLILFASACAFCFSQSTLRVEGRYHGKNFYVQNPFCVGGEDSMTFCIDSIHVNNVPVEFTRASAFELLLDSAGFKTGDPLIIEFFHRPDCRPKILNPEPITPKATYEIVSIEVTPTAELNWVVKNEQYKIPYRIEAYRWNKWITIGEVDGLEPAPTNSYSFTIIPHSGQNKVRVVQADYTLQKRPSQEVVFTSSSPAVKILEVDKEQRQVSFSGGTLYELYDESGNIVKKGYGNKIDCSDLKSKNYFLNYDNTNTAIKFKKEKSKP